MKIAIGCDHGGYLLKQDILIWLEEHNIDFEDVGCYSTESVDYPMYGEKVGRMVASGQCDKGKMHCAGSMDLIWIRHFRTILKRYRIFFCTVQADIL